MTPERMAEIRAREQAASKGPWQYEFAFGVGGQDLGSLTLGGYKPDRLIQEEDGIFIAHARQDVPDLLDEVERLLDTMEQLVKSQWEHRCEDGVGGCTAVSVACLRVVKNALKFHGRATLSDTPEEATP